MSVQVSSVHLEDTLISHWMYTFLGPGIPERLAAPGLDQVVTVVKQRITDQSL